VNGTGVVVTGNTSAGNGRGFGIGGTKVVLKHNRADGSFGIGFYAYGSNDSLLSNSATGNFGPGIEFAPTATGKANGNTLSGNGFGNGVVDGTSFGLKTAGASVTASGNHGEANNGPGCQVPSSCTSTATALPLATFSCNDNVDHSVRLQADVGSSGSPCSGDGLHVTKNDVTIDLNGFTIWGNSPTVPPFGYGISEPGHKGLSVLNGRINGFFSAIDSRANGNHVSRVENVIVSGSGGALVEGSKAVAKRNAFVNDANISTGTSIWIDLHGRAVQNAVVAGVSATALAGLEVRDGAVATHNVVRIVAHAVGMDVQGPATASNNVVVGSGGKGMTVSGNALLSKNIVVNSASTSVDAGGRGSIVGNVIDGGTIGVDLAAAHSFVSKNIVALTSGQGIVENGGTTKIAKNTVIATGGRGIEVDQLGDVVTRNRVYAAGTGADGIYASSVATDVKITHNDSSANAQNGIFVYGGVVDQNRTLANGSLGIEANPGTTGSNTSYGNVSVQCTPSSLC
jgi:parallel beta-helix repeat protein